MSIPIFIPQEQLLSQMAAADRWLDEELKRIEADGFVKEEPNKLIWTKRDENGNIIAQVTL